jgi:hypothetical protein
MENPSVLFHIGRNQAAGCSDIEATGENHRVRANLLTNVKQDHEKIENPRVHPGQPYNQGWWLDP